MTDRILGPGSTLGIVGGGQLGRMIAFAAADYGLKVNGRVDRATMKSLGVQS